MVHAKEENTGYPKVTRCFPEGKSVMASVRGRLSSKLTWAGEKRTAPGGTRCRAVKFAWLSAFLSLLSTLMTTSLVYPVPLRITSRKALILPVFSKTPRNGGRHPGLT